MNTACGTISALHSHTGTNINLAEAVALLHDYS